MKLDMYEINKLNPPGILELAGLLALVKRLIAMVADFGEANTASVRHARIINQNLKQLREGHDFNTNLRIRAWVLQTAERRAWVRTVIGEGRIARWQQDYDALARREIPPSQKSKNKSHAHSRTPTASSKPRKDYERKPFALPRLADLFIMPFDFSKETAFPTFTFDVTPPSRPRKTPGRKPVIFWPSELVADYTPEPELAPDPSLAETEPDANSKSQHDPPSSGVKPEPKPP